jgi:hypothetical protein
MPDQLGFEFVADAPACRPVPKAEPEKAAEARDRGLAIVERNNALWREHAMEAIAALPDGTEGVFEHFRIQVTPNVGHPGHPNAWGGVARSLIRKGVLAHTGRRGFMQTEASHGRESDILIKCTPVVVAP